MGPPRSGGVWGVVPPDQHSDGAESRHVDNDGAMLNREGSAVRLLEQIGEPRRRDPARR